MELTPVVALVPLRSPGAGKTRLAAHLTIEQRAALAGAMLADVCSALAAARVDRIVVVAGGPAAVAAAAALGLEVVADPPGCDGLDSALRAATGRLGRVGTSLVVTADLPRLVASDVRAVLEAEGTVVIAPTSDGGTGALLRRPPDTIPTAYGRRSAARHRALARAAGVPVSLVHRPGLATDLDTWADLRALDRRTVGPATAAVLEDLAPPAAEVG
jgi:2-phospho-L-lactate/phosphoenolpyruvate guanylyltransferase